MACVVIKVSLVDNVESEGADTIRIARPGLHPAGYRKTPDWKVVHGHAFAIPAYPPVSRAGLRKQKVGAAVEPTDGVQFPSGPWCRTAPGPLDALVNEVT